MTSQETPTRETIDPTEGDTLLSDKSTYLKFRDEILAGGASEQAPEGGELTVGGYRALIGLGVIALLLVALAMWSWWAFVFVVLLIGCIFLHELGHFATAKWTGMKATQFFLFMGPKLWSFRRGETEYGVRAYPVGAFVRIIGMNNLDDVDPADEHRAYRSKSYPRRMLVITAGSVMHMLIAVALLFGIYATKGSLQPSDEVAFSSVAVGGPAAIAGLLADDTVVAIDGQAVESGEQFVKTIQSHTPGDVVTVAVLRDGQPMTFEVGLGTNPNEGPAFGKAYFGTSTGQRMEWEGMPVLSAAKHSVTDLGSAAWQSVGGVVKVLNPVNIFDQLSDENADPAKRPTTVVGITGFSNTVGGETGFAGVLLLLAGVNVFVGLLNMFPVLPFDGGHAAIATYERIRSRPGRPPYRADVSKMVPVAMAMMGILAFLMFAGLYLDVARPLK